MTRSVLTSPPSVKHLAFPIALLLLSSGCVTTSKVIQRRFRLHSVIDGDTIRVSLAGKVESVRLVGIEAPEIRRTKKAGRQAEERGLTLKGLLAKGREATERLKKLVEGRRVTLVWPYEPGERDRFERLLAYVEVDGIDVGEVLLRGGFAWTLEKYEHPRSGRYRGPP